jgi:hypothetical protein
MAAPGVFEFLGELDVLLLVLAEERVAHHFILHLRWQPLGARTRQHRHENTVFVIGLYFEGSTSKPVAHTARPTTDDIGKGGCHRWTDRADQPREMIVGGDTWFELLRTTRGEGGKGNSRYNRGAQAQSARRRRRSVRHRRRRIPSAS